MVYHQDPTDALSCVRVIACECATILHTHDWEIQVCHKPGAVGMPLPGTGFRIVDPVNLETLPPGEDGLILIGGAQVMKGYLNVPEETAKPELGLELAEMLESSVRNGKNSGELNACSFI